MTNAFSRGLSRRAFLQTTALLGLGLGAGPGFAQNLVKTEGLKPAIGPFRWLDSGGQKGEFFKQYLAKYAQIQGIEVVYDGLPWKEIASVLPLGIRNQSAPDTFNLPIGMEPSVAIAEGWLQPIDNLIPDFDTWKKAYPDGAFVEGVNVFGGRTYGFPFSTERRFNNALLFNQDMMNAAGYDKIGADRALTFEEMRDAAKKMTEGSGGRSFGFIIGGAQEQRWGDVATMLAQRGGATVGNTGLLQGMDLKTGQFAFDHDAYVAGVELLLAMR